MEFKIDGFETMTPEEQLEAIKNYNPEEHGWVQKTTLDKATSDAAAYKKELKNAKDAATDAANTRKSLEERIQQLEKEQKISAAVAKYVGLGYNADLAQSSAEALISGDHDKLFENQQTFLTEFKKTATVEKLKSTPSPVGGNGNEQPTDFNKLIDEAKKRNDYPAVAYYTRLMQEKSKD